MDKQIQIAIPDYKKIYTDIIRLKYPQKARLCESILSKEELSVLDVIDINQMIFGKEDETVCSFNQKHRSYDKNTIITILTYQKKYKLNNTDLAEYFNLSRNTIAKWRKMFLV